MKMATVIQLKDGIWLVHWNAIMENTARRQWSAETDTTFLEHTIWTKSTYNQSNHQLTFQVRVESTRSTWQAEKQEPSGNRPPLKVTVLYNGQAKEMNGISGDQWGTVTWDDIYMQQDYHSSEIAAFQIILDCQETTTSGERQILAHLSKLLDSQTLADMTFVVKGQEIGAHVAIIVASSPVMAAMLEQDKFKEGRSRTVQIDDIEPAVFKEMLRYMYTGKSPLHSKSGVTEPLFLAADKYQIEDLKQVCETSLIEKVSLHSVVKYLVIANLHTATRLLEACLKFMEGNKRAVWFRSEWKELMKSYPDLFFMAGQRMVGH